eukprot:COSAG05_NODE_1253_length_5369_cov_14.480674_5_plen_193_part_00
MCHKQNIDTTHCVGPFIAGGYMLGGHQTGSVYLSTPLATMVYYRITNKGSLTWRPTVKYVKFFADSGCSQEVTPLVQPGIDCPCNGCQLCSSYHCGSAAQKGCQNAFDGSSLTSWRPGIHAPAARKIWIGAGFVTGTTISCVKALGMENNDGGGVAVESSTDGVLWSSVSGDGDSVTDTFIFERPFAQLGRL